MMTQGQKLALLSAAAVAIGCNNYSVQLSRPAEPPATLETRNDEVVNRDPLQYRIRRAGDRIMTRIVNPMDTAISLLPQSAAVVSRDEGGEQRRHAIAPMTIPARRQVTLYFPPRVDAPAAISDPLSYADDSRADDGGNTKAAAGQYADRYFEPRSITMPGNNDGQSKAWEWPNDSSLVVSLVYRQGGDGEPIRHEFKFDKCKAAKSSL